MRERIGSVGYGFAIHCSREADEREGWESRPRASERGPYGRPWDTRCAAKVGKKYSGDRIDARSDTPRADNDTFARA
jgi:hypothetical protein